MTKPVYDEQILSDLHKDARGFRPGELFWARWNDSTVEERNRIWEGLIRELEQSIEDDKQREAQAEKDWEAQVQKVIASGAGDRVVAVRWIVSALPKHQREHGAGYTAYCNGFPKSAEGEIKPYCYGRA